MERIPECVDVEIVDVAQLDDTNPTPLEEKFEELDALERADLQKESDALVAAWEEHKDPASGQPFYYNAQTGESVWERPEVMITPAAVPSPATVAKEPSVSFGNDGGMRPDRF